MESNTLDIYQFMYKGKQKWFYEIKSIDRRICNFIIKPSYIICDVGGGKGVDSIRFAKKGAFTINLDINSIALKIAKELTENYNLQLSFIVASATNLPFKENSLDLITCFSTLDHLPNKENAYKAIKEFSHAIKQFCYVAITVPNKFFLIGTISMIIKSLTERDIFYEQRFTPNEVYNALLSSGLKPIIFDSEYPISVGPGLLDHFPKFFKKIPGIINILMLFTKFFRSLRKYSISKLFGARMGYLSTK